MTAVDDSDGPPRLPNAILGPTSNIFYALASETPVWTYVLHHPDPTLNSAGPKCVGLWPLEALCLALLLDEGIRCDVALVVAFARCLKTVGHILSIDLHTRSEVALRDAAREVIRKFTSDPRNRARSIEHLELSDEDFQLAPDAMARLNVELPGIRRYSALMKYSENEGTFSKESFKSMAPL